MMTDSKPHSLQKFMAVALMLLGGVLSSASAQKTDQKLPVIAAGQIPLYPMTARVARVQGVVKIRVTTDGKKVTSVQIQSGPPMLANSAKKNILTWKFSPHMPTTFVTTFHYILREPAQCDYTNDVVTLRLPWDVLISAKGLKTCDPAAAK